MIAQILHLLCKMLKKAHSGSYVVTQQRKWVQHELFACRCVVRVLILFDIFFWGYTDYFFEGLAEVVDV